MKKHEKLVCEFAASLIDKYWNQLEDKIKNELTYIHKDFDDHPLYKFNKKKALKRILKSHESSAWLILEFYCWVDTDDTWTDTELAIYQKEYSSKFIDSDNGIIFLKGKYIRIFNNGCDLVKKVVKQVEKITYKAIK